MADKKPIVLGSNGKPQLIQSGDTIPVALITPGVNGQSIKTVSGVSSWADPSQSRTGTQTIASGDSLVTVVFATQSLADMPDANYSINIELEVSSGTPQNAESVVYGPTVNKATTGFCVKLLGSPSTSGFSIRWYAFYTGGAGSVAPESPYVIMAYEQPNGTNGGSVTAGAWYTYPLNVEDTDTANIATLSSSQVTLPTGVYHVNARVAFGWTYQAAIRLYDVTNSVVLVPGIINWFLPNACGGEASMCGRVSLSSSTVVRVEFRVAVDSNPYGLGFDAGFGSANRFGWVSFIKVG